MTSLSGLSSLTAIKGSLYIGVNNALASLHGLENLRSVGCADNAWFCIDISGNPLLESLKELDSLEPAGITDMLITDNTLLADCAIAPICTHLKNGGLAYIGPNAPGCNSIPEVEAACLVPIIDAFSTEPPLQIFPNPAGDLLHITTDGPEAWSVDIADQQGRVLYREHMSGDQAILLRGWPAGLYMLRAVCGDRVYAGRFVKQ